MTTVTLQSLLKDLKCAFQTVKDYRIEGVRTTRGLSSCKVKLLVWLSPLT